MDKFHHVLRWRVDPGLFRARTTLLSMNSWQQRVQTKQRGAEKQVEQWTGQNPTEHSQNERERADTAGKGRKGNRKMKRGACKSTNRDRASARKVTDIKQVSGLHDEQRAPSNHMLEKAAHEGRLSAHNVYTKPTNEPASWIGRSARHAFPYPFYTKLPSRTSRSTGSPAARDSASATSNSATQLLSSSGSMSICWTRQRRLSSDGVT